MNSALVLLLACFPDATKGTTDSAAKDSTSESIGDSDTACTNAIWYADSDGDSFGDPEVHLEACVAPEGYVAQAGDCDDTNGRTYPGNVESCDNGLDDDCDAGTPDASGTWYQDQDGDGYGDVAFETCSPTPGLRAEGGDCDDQEAAIHPGAKDLCGNGVDENCSPGCRETGAGDPGDSLTFRGVQNGWGSYTFAVGDLDNDGRDDAGIADIGVNCWFYGQYPTRVSLLSGPNAILDLQVPLDDQICGAMVANTGGSTFLLLSSDVGDKLLLYDLGGATNGLVTGIASGQADVLHFGAVLKKVGDLDGSGRDWMAVSAPEDAAAGHVGGGAVYVVPVSAARDLSINLPDEGLRIYGTDTNHTLGSDIAAADLDNDGYPDLAITGKADNSYQEGAVYLYSFGGKIPIGKAIPENDQGDIYYYGSIADTEFGARVALGDTDGDGAMDLAVAAPHQDTTGKVFHFSGPLLQGILEVDAADQVLGPAHGDSTFGSALAMVDLDGDGRDDLFVSNTSEDGMPANPPYVYGYYGKDFADSLELTVANNPYFGISLTALGDWDGDHLQDLLIGNGSGTETWVRTAYQD